MYVIGGNLKTEQGTLPNQNPSWANYGPTTTTSNNLTVNVSFLLMPSHQQRIKICFYMWGTNPRSYSQTQVSFHEILYAMYEKMI